MKKVFILHGWSYDTSKWTDFLNALKRYQLKPILLRIPGLTKKLETAWGISDYVQWLDHELKSEKEVVLIGHSNGGRIALNFILQHPNKVKKLFLIDSAGIYHNDLRVRFKRMLFSVLASIGKKITDSESKRKILYKLARENDYNMAPPIMRKTMQNLINDDLKNELEKIEVSTHIIWGRNDQTTPLKNGLLMHKKIKNSELHIIDNARHSPQFTHVEDVAKVINENI